MSTRNRIRVDVAIVGGGIAGLWLVNLLRARGYSAVLIERSAFGDGQTICSQGMIHGGLKYALSGALGPASQAISAMPARWRNCLAGHGEIDLRGVVVLSDRYYLWSTNNSTLGRLAGFFASSLLRGRIRRLERSEFPLAFDAPRFSGVVYELDELVIDTPSLLACLAETAGDCTLRGDVTAQHLIRNDDGSVAAIRLPEIEIAASRFLFTAGAGNEALVHALKVPGPAMQRRPLKQLILRHPGLPRLYAHCIEQLTGVEPRLTVTSHLDTRGEWLWYLGGQLASDPVDRSTDEHLLFARAELAACLPWLDLSTAPLEPLHIDRAEPLQQHRRRPDEAFVATVGNVMVCWPTKLTLAPDLGDKVLAALTIPPTFAAVDKARFDASRPSVADAPWNR